MTNGGVEIVGRAREAGTEGGPSPNPVALAGIIIAFVRDFEAELAIRAGEIEKDVTRLSLTEADRSDAIARLEAEAAYTAGQQDVLGRLITAIAEVSPTTGEGNEPL